MTMAPAFRKMLRSTSAMVYGNCAQETTVYSISTLEMTPLFFSAKLTKPKQSVMIIYPERRLKHENLE